MQLLLRCKLNILFKTPIAGSRRFIYDIYTYEQGKWKLFSIRMLWDSKKCPAGGIEDLYDLTVESDKVITF